ncbi:hypothetical protein KR026_005845, partial [Drosophila bipectinata]
VLSIFIVTAANYFPDVFKCNDFLLKCQESELKLGRYNGITNGYNSNCSQEIGSKWSKLTRCELEAAICLCKIKILFIQYIFIIIYFIVSQMNNLDVNCENIADVIQL